MTTTALRNVIRKTILESSTRTLDLAAILKKNKVTMPGKIPLVMVDLTILGSEGFETVSHLPYSREYQRGVDIGSPEIYQSISRAINADNLTSTLDGKVCTFEIDGYQYKFTFGSRPKSPAVQCREEAEALRTFYNVPENDMKNELEDKGWKKSEVRKALK